MPWEVGGRREGRQEPLQLARERVDDALLTLRSVKTVVEEAQEKCRVAWCELEEEIRALEDLRGKIR